MISLLLLVLLCLGVYEVFRLDAKWYPANVHTEVCDPLRSEGFDCDCERTPMLLSHETVWEYDLGGEG